MRANFTESLINSELSTATLMHRTETEDSKLWSVQFLIRSVKNWLGRCWESSRRESKCFPATKERIWWPACKIWNDENHSNILNNVYKSYQSNYFWASKPSKNSMPTAPVANPSKAKNYVNSPVRGRFASRSAQTFSAKSILVSNFSIIAWFFALERSISSWIDTSSPFIRPCYFSLATIRMVLLALAADILANIPVKLILIISPNT